MGRYVCQLTVSRIQHDNWRTCLLFRNRNACPVFMSMQRHIRMLASHRCSGGHMCRLVAGLYV